MSKSSHPHGKGKTLISCTVSNDVLEAIDYLAHKSGISRSAYAREAITNQVLHGAMFPAQEISDRKHGPRYKIPEIIAFQAAEKPRQPRPQRSVGA
jgi:hypothetical protein